MKKKRKKRKERKKDNIYICFFIVEYTIKKQNYFFF